MHGIPVMKSERLREDASLQDLVDALTEDDGCKYDVDNIHELHVEANSVGAVSLKFVEALQELDRRNRINDWQIEIEHGMPRPVPNNYLEIRVNVAEGL